MYYELVNQQTPLQEEALGGYWSVKLGSGTNKIEQVITNLTPNTTYEFRGRLRAATGETANIGVKNYGGSEVTSTNVSGNAPNWSDTRIVFTTGATNTSATIYANKSSSGSGSIYVDDFSVFHIDAVENFGDNFEDGNANDWNAVDASWGIVTDGTYRYEGSDLSASAITEAGNSSWTNYTLEATVKGTDISNANAAFYLLGRYTNNNNYYTFGYSKEFGGLVIRKKVNAVWTTLGSVYSFTPSANTDYTLKGEMNGNTLKLYLNGVERASTTDSAFSSGKIGLQAYKSTVRFDNVSVVVSN